MQKTPNPLPAGESQPTSRPTPTAAWGSSSASGARDVGPRSNVAPAQLTTSRVLRVPLAPLSDAAWQALRALAREGAAFCNAWLADAYAQRLGYQPPDGQSVFRRAAGSLSGDVRVALAREAFTTWRRHGGKILSGAQRLALFDADRALVCRAEHLSKGRRQIHARIQCVGTTYQLSARLVGKHVGGQHVFPLALDPRCDDYVQPVLDGLASGVVRLLKLSILFERPGRKVFALLTYQKTIEVPVAGWKPMARSGSAGRIRGAPARRTTPPGSPGGSTSRRISPAFSAVSGHASGDPGPAIGAPTARPS
jgi:hypothetical protein